MGNKKIHKVKFGVDNVKIKLNHRVDGTQIVVLETGEYMRDRLAELAKIDQGIPAEVTIEYEQEETR